MTEEIKKHYNVMIVVTAKVEFLAHEADESGTPTTAIPVGGVMVQGGGAIVKNAWEDATEKNHRGGLVRELLKQTMDQLPPEIVAAMGDLGQKAYDGEQPSKLIRPGAAQAMAMAGAQLKKLS